MRIQWCTVHELGAPALGMGPTDCPAWWSDWTPSKRCEWVWAELIIEGMAS